MMITRLQIRELILKEMSKFGRGDLPKRPPQPSFGLEGPEGLPPGNFLGTGEIQGEHPYDVAKNEVADRFREMDAVDEVLSDIMRLLGLTSEIGVDNFVNREEVEELSEVLDLMVQYDESLDSILRAIPDHIKDILVRF